MNFSILFMVFVHLILIFGCVASMGLLIDKKKTFSVNLMATIDTLGILLNFLCISHLIDNYLFS